MLCFMEAGSIIAVDNAGLYFIYLMLMWKWNAFIISIYVELVAQLGKWIAFREEEEILLLQAHDTCYQNESKG